MMLPPAPLPLPDGSQGNKAEACLRQRLHFQTQLPRCCGLHPETQRT